MDLLGQFVFGMIVDCSLAQTPMEQQTMSLEKQVSRLADSIEALIVIFDERLLSPGVTTSTAVETVTETPDPEPETPAATPAKGKKKAAAKKRATKKTAAKKTASKGKSKPEPESDDDADDLSGWDDLTAMKQKMADIADGSGVDEPLKVLKAFVKEKGYAMVSEIPVDERVGFMDEFEAHFAELGEGL